MSEIVFPIDCVFKECDFPNCTCNIVKHIKKTMTGKLNVVDGNWVVQYPKHPTSNKIYEDVTLLLHPDDAMYCFPSDIGKEILFETIDEFTHPELFRGVGWGDGTEMAKLV